MRRLMVALLLVGLAAGVASASIWNPLEWIREACDTCQCCEFFSNWWS
ncbi:MAG: hypothetical protein FJY73_10595 [Candidatus Eisenbacteria bacterium]|nr:hypothetical protein [Candidatus Eisenbacteria bacterium]